MYDSVGREPWSSGFHVLKVVGSNPGTVYWMYPIFVKKVRLRQHKRIDITLVSYFTYDISY